jgi:hypothetical protein
MKRFIIISLILLVFSACNDDYVMTEFYVKNTSHKTISFEASVIKFSQITDPYEVFLQFTVNPNDSVLARRIEVKQDAKEPHKWFNTFVIHPVEGIEMNDPNLLGNWIKHNSNDTPIYVFTLNKN